VSWAVGFERASSEVSFGASVVEGETAGGARFADRERQRSETPVRLSQPTAQRVCTHMALAAMSEPFIGRDVTGRAPIEIGDRLKASPSRYGQASAKLRGSHLGKPTFCR
jgi:hypothetical protein